MSSPTSPRVGGCQDHCVKMGNMFKGLKEMKGSSLKSDLKIKRTSHKIKLILVYTDKVKWSFL